MLSYVFRDFRRYLIQAGTPLPTRCMVIKPFLHDSVRPVTRPAYRSMTSICTGHSMVLDAPTKTLYIFAGTFEKGDQEFTFDEMWQIDLGKLDGVKEVFKRELEAWQGSEDEDSDEDEEGSDEDEEEEEEEEDATEPETPATSVAGDASLVASESTAATEFDSAEQEGSSSPKDDRPMPRPFESLRDFFDDRTKAGDRRGFFEDCPQIARRYRRSSST